MAIRIFFRNMSQALANPGFMQEKVQKAIARIEIFLLVYVPMNLSKAWNTELEVASFFAV